MRGLAGRLWLAAAAAMLVDVAKGASVLFTVAEFGGGPLPATAAQNSVRVGIFQVTPNDSSFKTFAWTAAPGVKVNQIKLSVRDPTTNRTRVIGESTIKDASDNTASNINKRQQRPNGDQNPPQNEIGNAIPLEGPPPTPLPPFLAHSNPAPVIPTAAGGTVIIDLSKAIQGVRYLYFEALWHSTTSGRSFSPAFAVLDISNTNDFTAAGTNLPAIFHNDPFSPEEQQRTDLNSGTGTSGGDGTSSGPTLGSAPMPTANDSNGGTSGSVSGNTGLSTGATAGIGAACGVLGLLLIAFAIWYFLRKKKQRQQHGAIPPYDETGGVSRTRTDELMAAEKEANLSSSSPAAAVATYSDSPAAVAHRSSMSGGATAPLIAPVAAGAAAAAAAAADGPPGYTPYTDRPASGAGSAGTGTAVGAGEEPAVVSREYAHLVEEGMTAEEIRRLEEEERALDAAIEQAVRRPTG